MDQCETCGIGFFLPSGRCDHCNTSRVAMGLVEIALTGAECNTLASLSNKLDLPQAKVMAMALRHYESALSEGETPKKLATPNDDKRDSVHPHCPTAVELIAAERERQIKAEDWSREYDDGHDDGELARAAACYSLPAGYRSLYFMNQVYPCPWSFKPSPDNRIRELVKAGALIAAEIERLQRLPD